MNRLLSKFGNSTENCSLDEWLQIHPDLEDAVRFVRLSSKRDPLGDVKFPGIDVEFIAGFSTKADALALIYFWSPDFGNLSYANERAREEFLALIRFAMLLGSIGGSAQPNLLAIRNGFEAEISRIFTNDADYLDKKHLYWLPDDDMLCVALYSVSGASEAFSTRSILEHIGLNSDYFRLKSPVWNSVPMTFLFGRVQKSPKLVAKLLLEPKCFNPFEAVPPDWFLWPWQRSLSRGASGGAVRYAPMDTTSLIFDLRKSTMALEQLRDEDIGLFSSFIKEIVAAAKQAVFAEGGFFDKETGDGMVAHFCDFALPEEAGIKPTPVRAFTAARKLIKAVHAICHGFQEHLNMGVGGLGASVGLHSAKAVWVCEENLVSAYGESAIMASRLCAEAEIGAIFVSNYEFQKLAKCLPAEEISRFERQAYVGKEYSERAHLFGYLMQVAEPLSATTRGRRKA